MTRRGNDDPREDPLQRQADKLLRANGHTAYTTEAIHRNDRRWANTHEQCSTEQEVQAYPACTLLYRWNELRDIALMAGATERQVVALSEWFYGCTSREIARTTHTSHVTAAEDLNGAVTLIRVWSDRHPLYGLAELLAELECSCSWPQALKRAAADYFGG